MSKIIFRFSTTLFCKELGSSPIFFNSLLLSIALTWSIIIALSLFNPLVPLFKLTLKILTPFLILVVMGQIIEEGCTLFKISL